MANRPYYYVDCNDQVQTGTVDFKWYPGFSIQQKQKSISSLHRSIKSKGVSKILEVSSKSCSTLGVSLSAFNLKLTIPSTKINCTVESAFQGSKVFQHGGPFNDLFAKDSRTARAAIHDRDLGQLIGFDFGQGIFPVTPTTAFYDWLYLNAVLQNKNLFNSVVNYCAFTDIEFNPNKSFNCQAFSVAFAVSIFKSHSLKPAISFDRVCNSYPRKDDTSQDILVQNELF